MAIYPDTPITTAVVDATDAFISDIASADITGDDAMVITRYLHELITEGRQGKKVAELCMVAIVAKASQDKHYFSVRGFVDRLFTLNDAGHINIPFPKEDASS